MIVSYLCFFSLEELLFHDLCVRTGTHIRSLPTWNHFTTTVSIIAINRHSLTYHCSWAHITRGGFCPIDSSQVSNMGIFCSVQKICDFFSPGVKKKMFQCNDSIWQ